MWFQSEHKKPTLLLILAKFLPPHVRLFLHYLAYMFLFSVVQINSFTNASITRKYIPSNQFRFIVLPGKSSLCIEQQETHNKFLW